MSRLDVRQSLPMKDHAVSGEISQHSDSNAALLATEGTDAATPPDDGLMAVLDAIIQSYGSDLDADSCARAICEAFELSAVAIAYVTERHVRYHGLSHGATDSAREASLDTSIFRRLDPGAAALIEPRAALERKLLGIESEDESWAHLLPVVEHRAGMIAIASYGARDRLADPALDHKLTIVGMILAASMRTASQVASERTHLDRLIRLQNLTARIIRQDGFSDTGPDILEDIAQVFEYDAVRIALQNGAALDYYEHYRNAVTRRDPVISVTLEEDVAADVVLGGVPQFFNAPALPNHAAIYPFDVRQLICVPLRVNGEIAGVLSAASGGSRALVVDDLSMLMMLAESLGLVLANSRRLYEVERRNRQLRVVDTLVTLIAERPMIQEAIPEVARAIARRFAFDQVGIGLLENERLKVTLASVHVPMPPVKGFSQSFGRNRGISGRVLTSGRAEIIHDVRNDPDFVDTGWNARSEICVPIWSAGAVIGIVNVETSAERPLDNADLEVLQIIARHLGIAFENEELLASERSTRRAMEALNQVSTIVTSTLDVDEALRRIVDTLGSYFDYRYVVAGMTEGQFVQPSAAHGVALERLVRIPTAASPIGRVAVDGKPLEIKRLTSRTDLGLDAFPDGQSLIVVPITGDGHILGILIVIGSRTRELTEQDTSMLQMFAQHAGVVLDNARMYEEARRMAYLDPMTHLPNHRHFQERFTEDFERASEGGSPLAVMVIDLDGFKQINDRFGHLEGDAVLIDASRRLSSKLRERDLLARYAGDEFVVLLPDTDIEAAMLIGQRLRDAIGGESFEISTGERATLTISVGVAVSPEHGNSTRELLNSADNATYAAKHAGRNRVCRATLPDRQ